MKDYAFKTPPLKHQLEELLKSTENEYAGYFWEPGLGKTYLILNQVGYLYEQGLIDSLFVVAPNGVHLNWLTDEFPKHFPDHLLKKMKAFVYHSKRAANKSAIKEREALLEHKGLAVLLAAYEGTITDAFKQYMKRFFTKRKSVLMCLDESHRIKGRTAKVKLTLVAMGCHAKYRRILTGSPVEEPPDIYSQLRFLDQNFWKKRGFNTSVEFDSYFCEFEEKSFIKRGQGGRIIRDKDGKPLRNVFQAVKQDANGKKMYKNIDHLQRIVAEACTRLTLEEAGIHLPPITYSKRYYDMFPEQARMYRELETKFRTEFEDGLEIDGEAAITRLLRLQQIICGYVGTGPGEPIRRISAKENPRLELLLDLVEDLPHAALIWCRFTQDIDQICNALGDKCVRYDGKVDNDGRALAKSQFQSNKVQFMVMSEAGAEGLTLINAQTAIFYSNDFKMTKRLQKEARCVLEGTPVLTPSGWIPIEQIKVDDLVIGSSGLPRKVLDCWSKGATKNLVSVSVKGYIDSITTTYDHMWLTAEGQWKKADDLRPGDLLAQPDTVDVAGLTEILFPEHCRLGNKGLDASNPRYKRAPDSIALDQETLFALGYFAGDGYASIRDGRSKFISFSGNTTTKKDSMDRIKSWLSSLGLTWSESVSTRCNKVGTEVRCYYGEMGYWFNEMFGSDCHNKKLPVLSLNNIQSKWLLEGLMSSDGYYRKGRYEYCTVSKTLAGQVFWLITRCGYKPCISRGTFDQYLISYTETMEPGFKVNKIEINPPNKGKDGKRQNVYDLTVDQDESFVVGGCVVHNCHRIGQDKPVHVIDLVCNGTVDNRIINALRDKKEIADMIVGDKMRAWL